MTFRDEGSERLHQAWLAEQLRHPGVVGIELRALAQSDTVELAGGSTRGCRTAGPRPARTQRRQPLPGPGARMAAPDSELTGTLRQVLRVRLRDVGYAGDEVVAAAGAIARPSTDEELCARWGTRPRCGRPTSWACSRLPRCRGRFRARHRWWRSSPTRACCPSNVGFSTHDWHSGSRTCCVPTRLRPRSPRSPRTVCKPGTPTTRWWAGASGRGRPTRVRVAEGGRWYPFAVDGPLHAPAVTGTRSGPRGARAVRRPRPRGGRAARCLIDVLDPFLDSDEEKPSGRRRSPVVHRSWHGRARRDRRARGDLDRAVPDSEDGTVSRRCRRTCTPSAR